MANAVGTALLNATPTTLAWLSTWFQKQQEQMGGAPPAAEPNKLAELARAWGKGLAQQKVVLSGAERCCTHSCASTAGASEADRSQCCGPCFALGLLGLLLALWFAWLGRR
jgi:hypothetical protein